MRGSAGAAQRIAHDRCHGIDELRPGIEARCAADPDPLRTGEGLCLDVEVVKDLQVVVFGGGYPIKAGDVIVGAIGVSGGHYKQDMEVAEAGTWSPTWPRWWCRRWWV